MTAIAEVEVVQKALSVPDQAKALIISSNETYVQADEILLTIKGIQKEIDAAFDPIITKAHQAHKEAVAQKKRAEAPLVEAAGILKPRMASYRAEQERIRQEKERIAQEEARKRAEEEALQAALAAEKEGDKEAAEAILAEPVQAPTVIVEKMTPKTTTTFRTQYSAVVTDLKALVKAISEGKVPIQAIEANMTFLNSMARNLKESLNFPGVRVNKRTV